MAVTEDEFVRKVKRLERRAHKHPTLYRSKVAGIVVLGYVLLLGLIFGSFGAVAGIIYIGYATDAWGIDRFAFVFLFLGIIILRALWVKLTPPNGKRVPPDMAPELLEEVNKIRTALKVAPLDAIFVDNQFNAAVVEQPRFLGLFGDKRYLIVGLPLMALMGKKQFLAILAHEFGHLSGRHGQFGSWIYRIRSTWYVLQTNANQARRGLVRLLRGFLAWYVPIILSNTFVLVRQHEYEADRCASDLFGSAITADALAFTSVYGEIYNSFYWKKVFDGVEKMPEPSLDPYTNMRQRFRDILVQDLEKDILHKELEKQSNIDDTHPSLAQRLKALGIEEPGIPQWPEAVALEFLGTWAEPVLEEFDRLWRDSVATQWKQRYLDIQEAHKKLKKYKQEKLEDLDEKELQDFAALATNYDASVKAEPIYEYLLSRSPNNAVANYKVGIKRLEQKDETGIQLIEKAMDTDHQAVQPGCQVLYGYFKDAGRDEDAEIYAGRWRKQKAIYDQAAEERRLFRAGDVYKEAALDEQTLQNLHDALGKFPWISKAYLVQKDVKYFPESPVLLLGIMIRRPKKVDKNALQALGNSIQGIPQLVVVRLNKPRKLRAAIKRTKGVKIFQPGKKDQ